MSELKLLLSITLGFPLSFIIAVVLLSATLRVLEQIYRLVFSLPFLPSPDTLD